jgi:putative addiction module killer protein
MMEVREYLDRGGRSLYAAWFDRLNREAAAKVTAALVRIQQGNLSNAKGVGAGVYEYRIDFGPGYRIYFGRDGDRLVILSWRRNEKAPAGRYQSGVGPVARL